MQIWFRPIWSLVVVGSLAILLLALPGLAAPQEKLPPPSSSEPKVLHQAKGCTAAIGHSGSGTDPDSAWETCSGGSLNIEIIDSSTGGDQYHTKTPGHKYIDTITLRAPLITGRKGASEQDQVLENGNGRFAIEIEGAPVASANVESITMEDLVIDVREMTTGADWDYRVYGPGDAHYGNITIRSRSAGELYGWWFDNTRGQNIRKSISVIVKKRDGGEARRFNYLDCFPLTYIPHSLDQPGQAATKGIVARCTGITLHGEEQQALYRWINETLAGKEYRRTLTLTEEVSGDTEEHNLQYHDAFPVRYVFPQLSASGTGNLYEEISIKPIRLELP